MTDIPTTVEKPEPVRLLQRTITRLTVTAGLLAITVTALVLVVIAYAHSNTALRGEARTARQVAATSQEAKNVASCVNEILGARAPLTTADTDAETDFISQIVTVLTAPVSEQARLYQTFLQHAAEDVATLKHDKVYRADHPLGHCG